MFVYLASDHAGFELKEEIKNYLKNHYQNFEIKDFGAFAFDAADDYPDFINPCIKEFKDKISTNEVGYAFVFGGSGTGEAICANRFSGVRALVFNGNSLDIVRLARQHNDANVMSFGARFVDVELAKNAAKIFLETKKDESPRHKIRIEKIDK